MKKQSPFILLLTLFLSTSFLSAQDVFKVLSSEGGYYNEKQQPCSKEDAVFLATTSHFENGLERLEKQRISEPSFSYQFYYQQEETQHQWKTLDPKQGLKNTQKKDISYCPDNKISKSNTIDWGAPDEYFFDLLQFYMKRKKSSEALKLGSNQGSVLIRVTFNEKGYLQKTCVVEGKHPILDEEAFQIGNSMHQIVLPEQPQEISWVVPIFFKSK